ncbi:hypothetical protein O181_020838 [Austropuccinia psidii MF-1]|uniref:Uncharacterized protein n=1 Tax=Austropuccinia psidii MF-1 TaxID=1389203 RepID=A0A9Q3CDP9_9BASI|nr:hypothetical protein [Austropuccinia psidii MF-1]
MPGRRTRGIVRQTLPVSSAKRHSRSGGVLSWMTWGIGPCAHANAHAPAPAPTVLCGGLYQCHLQNNNPTQAESFHGRPGEAFTASKISNCAIIMLEGESALAHTPAHPHMPMHTHTQAHHTRKRTCTRTCTRTCGIVRRTLPVSSAKRQSRSGGVLSWMTW